MGLCRSGGKGHPKVAVIPLLSNLLLDELDKELEEKAPLLPVCG